MKHFDIDSIDNRDPAAIDRIYRLLQWPLERYFRAKVRGLERIPTGPGLYVGNHSSGVLIWDSFLFAGAVYRELGLEQVPYGLGHEVAISLPLFHQIIVPLGAVRASHDNAHKLFRSGRKVIVYPGGDLDAMRPYARRNEVIFGGRRGYIRLALRAGVPIIPVVSAGSHETFMILDQMNWLRVIPGLDRLLRAKVWPTTLSMPWGITPGPPLVYLPFPARILIEVLDPIDFDQRGEAAAKDEGYVTACAARVERSMQRALERLAQERRR
jgi:1-acyl-sn-glycerol-3-phosphate acyltransferase